MEEDFDAVKFEQNLTHLKNSQHSIQSLSSWCTERRQHHKKIVTSWLNVLKQVKIDQRLILFNLANDVIQNSKRKNYEFVASWGTALQRATTMVRDDPKVKQKIARIFKIWEERSIYNEEFLSDLNGLLNTVTASKRLSADNRKPGAETDPDDFQASQLISQINNAIRLQERTDKAFKLLSKTPTVDMEKIRSSGKDREHVEGIQKETNDSVAKLEYYISSLKSEIKARNILIAALGQADEFYRSQRGDVKTVAIAYRNFGLRIKTMKKKLDELTTTLPSPIPSPDINAPSPPPDADIELPDDNAFESFLTRSASSSFLDSSQLPFDLGDFDREDTDQRNLNTIQVISDGGFAGGSAPQPVPPVGASSNAAYGNHLFGQDQPHGYNVSNEYSSGKNTPPTLIAPPKVAHEEVHEEYTPSSSWNTQTNTWASGQSSMPLNKGLETGPFFPRENAAPPGPDYSGTALETSTADVDQRPPNNSLLSKIESRLVDVDHRNLISLTGSPGGSGNGSQSAVPINTNVPPPMVQKPGLLPTPPTMPNMWQPPPLQPLLNVGNNAGSGPDTDFRTSFMQQHGIPPPPMPPGMGGYYGPPGNSSFDNIDSVDMEMSDEEQDGGNGSSLEDNGNSFMNFPPGPQGQWNNNGMHDSSPANGNNTPWNNKPLHGAGPFFPPGGGGGCPGGSPMLRPGGPMNPNFRGRGGFNRGGAMGSPGNGAFRGRGSPFRGGNFRGVRGNGRGMW